MRSMNFVVAKVVLGTSCCALAAAALAQTTIDERATGAAAADASAASDPNVYRPTARVNGEIITQTDIDQRTALFAFVNNAKLSPEESEQLKVQVFSALVDEKLKIQEAKANDIVVSDEEVLARFNQVAAQYGQTPQAFAKALAANGSSSVSLASQLRAEMAWDRLLGRKVEPFTSVSTEEVQAIIDRMKLAKGTAEYRLAEIYLSASPETAQATFDNAERIVEKIKQGGSFGEFARQFSEASTAVVGGDLGYVRLDQLPASLAETAAQLQPGQLAGPIEVPGGFSIVYLVDVKRILMADARDAVLSLKQMTMAFPPGTTPETGNAMAAKFVTATQQLNGCGSVDAAAAQLDAKVVSREDVAMRDLPAQLQTTLSTLAVGRATQPFGSQKEGISVLVLCGRETPSDVAAPSASVVEQQLLNDKIDKRAKRYLRDLRLDALIQYS
ncbi:peptidylprolyl isomerase [Flavisphingopyxis soli]|nr:peptidylprolyl isomerase [Sphingorhabdus soli]